MGLFDTLADAARGLKEDMAHYAARDGEKFDHSREMALYVLLVAMQHGNAPLGAPGDNELQQLLAGDTSYFNDPDIAAVWTRQKGVPLPADVRAAMVEWYTAVGRALHILDDQVIPLLAGPLRPLTPPGETAIDRVLDNARARRDELADE